MIAAGVLLRKPGDQLETLRWVIWPMRQTHLSAARLETANSGFPGRGPANIIARHAFGQPPHP